MGAPCLRSPKFSSRVVLVVLCWSPTMEAGETVGISGTAFINAFTELDVPRSSGAISRMYRAGYAARVLVGSVLVMRRCLAVVCVLCPACSGDPFGLVRWVSVAQSTTSAVEVSLWVVPEV